ncbi:MAG: hypothetical protein GX444_09545 [Myxococcales bacterium]|nr:hypothetical protein [Myxococcales bacterium]
MITNQMRVIVGGKGETTIRFFLFLGLLTCCWLLPGAVFAQEAGGLPDVGAPTESQAEGETAQPADQPTVTDEAESPAFLGEYGRWIKHAEHMAMTELDLWGSSSTIPEGFGVMLFGYGTMRAAQRYDNRRKLIDIIPVFDIPDPFHIGGNFFSLDFNVHGSTKGYFAGFMYGITDTLMIGSTTMLADIEIKMDPIFTPGSCERLGVATRAEFYRLLEQLGRPRPKHYYKSEPLDWGDTDLFVTWNWYRSKYFSTATTQRLYLPTAHRAEPDKAIIFALGPDLDVGNAAWGLNLSEAWDFRPPAPANIVTFSLGAEGAIYFQTKRKSPKFLKPNRDVWDYMKSQGVELDFFPDLSDIDPYYYYTPPPWVAVSGGFGIGPISLTYRHGWGFNGKYETNSPGFKKVIDEIGLVGTGDDGKIVAAASLPLTPLYIPGIAQFRFEYRTDGRNSLVFRDVYQMGVGFLIPIAPPEKYRLPKKKEVVK